jgi:hypothetical protein
MRCSTAVSQEGEELVGVGVVKGGIWDCMPISVNCVVNACLIEQRAFPCDVLGSAEGGAAWACECFGGVRRTEPFGIRPRECVVDGKLKGCGGGAAGVEWVFGFLALHVFLHVNCCRPEGVVTGGRCFQYDMRVCVSIGGLAGDCSPEITNAAFPVKVDFPVKEGSCTCSVLLKSG